MLQLALIKPLLPCLFRRAALLQFAPSHGQQGTGGLELGSGGLLRGLCAGDRRLRQLQVPARFRMSGG